MNHKSIFNNIDRICNGITICCKMNACQIKCKGSVDATYSSHELKVYDNSTVCVKSAVICCLSAQPH